MENLLNITTHFSTNFAPIELHFGTPIQDEINKIVKFPSTTPLDRTSMITLAKDNIEKSFNRRKKNQSKEVSNVILKINDLVMLRVRHLSNALDKVTQKFFHLYEGPFRIDEIIGEDAYVLVDPSDSTVVKGTYNRRNLSKYRSKEKSGSVCDFLRLPRNVLVPVVTHNV